MSGGKATPGPWRVEEVPHAQGVRRLIKGEAAIELATVRGDPRAAEVNDANAKLIAAAPALADALYRLVAILNSHNVVNVECATKDVANEMREAEEACRAALRAAGRLP